MHVVRTPSFLKRLAPRGLLARSLLILVVPLIILQVVTAIIFYDRHWDTVMRRLAGAISGEVAVVIDLMDRHPEPEDRRWIFTTVARHMNLELQLRRGEVLPNAGRAPNGALEDVMTGSLAERVRRPFVVEADMLDRDLMIAVQLSEGVLVVNAPRKRLFSSTTYIFVMWMVGTSMVLFGIATVFMSNQVRSIRRLAAGADGFGKGRDLPPIKPEGAREVRQAAHAFNVMRDRIRRQIAQRTEMLAGVSHDLRTPLTRMKLQLAMMSGADEAGDLAEDVAEMERMVDGYLAFARGEGLEPVAEVDLGTLVDEVASRFQRNGAAVEVAGTAGTSILLPIRRNAMERCLSNLIANAVRYGKAVRISLARDEDGVEISVEDDGPGVPVEQREDVFKAFFRGEPSRNPKTGGTGLGLTIARDVVRSHGGDLALEDSEDLGGLKAVIRLPV
jgi:two-component system osmolarity sensor histidine kinase EnvZ